MELTTQALDKARVLLCQMQDCLRDHVVMLRDSQQNETLAAVAKQTASDTIYAIDKAVENVIIDWFNAHWPREWPTQLVIEGLDEEIIVLPEGSGPEPVLTCIIDPIDGTRGLMYDKRSAWSLAGIAVGTPNTSRLEHIQVAAMTELPTTKQWRADQVSAVQGCGLISEAIDVRNPAKPRTPITLRPSSATDFQHCFASFSKFFPEGRVLTAQLEESLWERIVGLGISSSPVIFDDEYISTGGQIYELMCGHDRLVGDLRPYALRALGLEAVLICHPYDICTEMLAREAGCIVEHPLHGRVRAPLDTTSAVCWVAYANETLASMVRPLLAELVNEIRGLAPRNKRPRR